MKRFIVKHWVMRPILTHAVMSLRTADADIVRGIEEATGHRVDEIIETASNMLRVIVEEDKRVKERRLAGGQPEVDEPCSHSELSVPHPTQNNKGEDDGP